MKRRIISLFVALCLIAALLPMSVLAASYPDTDGHWAESSIDRWSEAAVVQGTDGEFRPDLSITRAQIATIFARLLRLPEASPAEYHDLTADAWYADAVSRCAAAGILTGYPDGTFRPNDPVTREQACAMLARALGISELRRADLSDFPDAADTGDWAKGYVAAMLNRDILTGLSGKLAPKAPVTRAQFVTMLDRAIAVYADEDGMTVKAADMDEDGVIVVVAEDVKIKDAPAGTKVVASAKAKGLKVNGKSVDADQVHTVPETVERPKSAGHAHTHEYKYTDNGDGTHTGVCTANDSTLDPAEHVFDGNRKCTICGAEQPADAVASVLGEDGTYTYYDSLIKALNAVANGGTVKLVTDETLDAQLAITKSVTIDLGGHTLTSTVSKDNGKDRYSLLTWAAMTIKNGTYKGTGDARGIAACAPLTLDGVTVDVAGLVSVGYSAPNCTYVIKNSNIKGNYSLANFVNNAKITITDSKITGVGNVLYHNGSNYGLDLTVTDTTITGSGDGYGVYISGSTTTLANGGPQKARFTNCTISGKTAVEVKYTDLTMQDCTVTATGTLSYTQNDNGPTANGFAVVSTDNATNNTMPKPKGIVTIKGGSGKYTGLVGLGSLDGVKTTYEGFSDTTYAITGGTFSSDPSDYVAAGYITLANGDGTFTVSDTNEIPVTAETVQDYLDGKYGSINGKTLVLGEGNYSALELGRATKYVGSNTEYYILTNNDTNSPVKYSYKEFCSIKNNTSAWSGSPLYIRSMSNITLKAASGASVMIAGVNASSGHKYVNAHDYVLDRDVANGNNTYYLVFDFANITFDGLTFTAKSDINTSLEQSNIDRFTFKNCTFNINNTADGNQAIRYYNENDNGKVSNLVVDNCKFNNCHQGVYTNRVKNVIVTNSEFDTTGHNAIAIQDFNVACNHGEVIITGNTFTNIGDRIIRFNNVGAGTQITIIHNTATNSGDSNNEVIKATSLAEGVNYNIHDNSWGEGKTVVNDELKDSPTGPM